MSHQAKPNKPLYAPIFEAICQVVVCCDIGFRVPINKLATRRIVDDSTGMAITFFNVDYPQQCLAVVTGKKNQSMEFYGFPESALARAVGYVMQQRVLNQARLNARLNPHDKKFQQEATI